MDRQNELGQLYEIKRRLEEIESLKKAIDEKEKAIAAEKKKTNNISVQSGDTEHVSRERKRIDSEKKKRHKRIVTSLTVIIICVYVAFSIAAMVTACNYFRSIYENLSENESISIFIWDNISSGSVLIILLVLLIFPVYICLSALSLVIMWKEGN